MLLLGSGEEVTVLRDTARAVWEAFADEEDEAGDGSRTVAEVADAMAARYDVQDGQILRDIRPFIETLLAKHLLVVHPPERPGPRG
ncbi:MAG: PqqD family protein [Acidimicrobiales bacterium]